MNDGAKIIVFNKHGTGSMVRVDHFPLPGETIKARQWIFNEDAAKGSNVAVAIGRNGVIPALVCRVGDDEAGRLGKKWLEEVGADISHYTIDSSIKTDTGLVVIREDGENYIIGSERHECYSTMKDVEDAIRDFCEAKIFVSGLEMDQDLPYEACRYAKEHGLITVLNPSPIIKPVPKDLRYLDYLFVNELEAEQMILEPIGKTMSEKKEAAQKIRQVYGCGNVIVTLGGEGCLLSDEAGTHFYPTFKVPVVDTIGAGDAFMAAFVSALTWDYSGEQAAEWANLYAAVTVSRKGAVLSYPTAEEVRKQEQDLRTNSKKEGS